MFWFFFISAMMEKSCLLSASSLDILSLQVVWGEVGLPEAGG
jgi:hypothetical protein